MLTLKKHAQLHEIVDHIFDLTMAKELDKPNRALVHLAEDAQLSVTTVRNLYTFRTKYPRAQTVLMLAQAVGLSMSFTRLAPTKRKAKPKLRLLA